MFKKSGNPKVEELTKSWKGRHYNLGGLMVIKKTEEDKVVRYCAWCGEGKLNHGNQKYCTELCSVSAMAWSYPQMEQAMFMLLVRQEWRCQICSFDYRELAENLHREIYRGWGGAEHVMGEKFDWHLIKRLKRRCPKDRRLEVDHIEPIYKGGNSLGLDNHQAICYTCHKSKTSKDLKGKRK